MLKKTVILVLVLVAAFGMLLLLTRSTTFEVRDSLEIDQDPELVWQVLADVEHWPQWWPGVETARLDTAWGEGETLELAFKGNPADGPARIDRYLIGQEIAFSRDGVLGSRAGTGFLFEPQAGVVLVTVESVVRGPQAFLARFTGRDAFADYHQRLLAALGERVRQTAMPGRKKESPDGR